MQKKQCCICGCSVGNGTDRVYKFKDAHYYCKKHYLQMYRHGHILKRTKYDPNEYNITEYYAECICYDAKGNENGRVKIDINKVDQLRNFKIYIRDQITKKYATITVNKRKYFLHRYLLNLAGKEFTTKEVVDHINGDSLDNRIENLRICDQYDNMKNIKKKNNKITGVALNSNKNKKWVARIMSNYQTYNLGTFDTYEEAAYNRILKEKELFGKYGPNKNLYYI